MKYADHLGKLMVINNINNYAVLHCLIGLLPTRLSQNAGFVSPLFIKQVPIIVKASPVA